MCEEAAQLIDHRGCTGLIRGNHSSAKCGLKCMQLRRECRKEEMQFRREVSLGADAAEEKSELKAMQPRRMQLSCSGKLLTLTMLRHMTGAVASLQHIVTNTIASRVCATLIFVRCAPLAISSAPLGFWNSFLSSELESQIQSEFAILG